VALAVAYFSNVDASCLETTVGWKKQRADFVFDGTAIRVERIGERESMATVAVHGVWKGKVQKTTTVYFEGGIDGPFINAGDRMVFFAQQGHGSAENAPVRSMWVHACGMAVPFDNQATIKQLGRSRKPS
jgi:hypothetical protein